MKSNLFGLIYIFLTIGDVYSMDIEVKVGDKVNLCCQLTYNRDDGLILYGSSIRLKMLFKDVMNDLDFSKFRAKYPEFDAEKVNGTLCLTKPAATLADDNFQIECQIQEKGMFKTLAEEKVTLRVYEELKFEIKPPEILNSSIGESKSIECRASGSPDLQVIWRTEKEGKRERGDSFATLEIKNITAEMNQLKYTCEASTSIPKTRRGSIITQVMTLNVYFKPEMNIEMSVVHTELGDTENVTITLKGNPSPKLDCQLLNVQAHRYVSISNPDPFVYIWMMIINNVTQRHIGNYNCKASNSQGVVTKEVVLSLKPGNLQITSPNNTFYSNYYLLAWGINSKSVLKNSSISVQMDEAGNWSVERHLILTEKELGSKQLSPGNQANNWKKTFEYPLLNLTSGRQYKIFLKTCNRHECIDSTNTAFFKTPISDDKNTFDPKIHFVGSYPGNEKSSKTSVVIRSNLLFVVTQSMTLFLISVVLQQIY